MITFRLILKYCPVTSKTSKSYFTLVLCTVNPAWSGPVSAASLWSGSAPDALAPLLSSHPPWTLSGALAFLLSSFSSPSPPPNSVWSPRSPMKAGHLGCRAWACLSSVCVSESFHIRFWEFFISALDCILCTQSLSQQFKCCSWQIPEVTLPGLLHPSSTPSAESGPCTVFVSWTIENAGLCPRPVCKGPPGREMGSRKLTSLASFSWDHWPALHPGSEDCGSI